MKVPFIVIVFAFSIPQACWWLTGAAWAEEGSSGGYQSFHEWFIEKVDRDPSVWDSPRDTIQPISKRLAYDTHQKEFVILPEEIPEYAFKPMSSEQREDPKLKPFVGSATEPPRLRPFLSSGGMWNWLTLNPFLPGHYDVTWEVLNEPNSPWSFKSKAAEVVADASRDPDLFEWKCPAAHAQNPYKDSGESTNDFSVGKHAFFGWVRDRLFDIQAAQAANDDRLALYQLGRVLHSIQDLASHRGMDNAEHSWLDHQGQGPDEDVNGNIPLAKTLTREFLENIVGRWEGINYPRLKTSEDHLRTWGYFEIQERLGFSKQLSMEEYRVYKKLGEQLPKSLRGLSGPTLQTGITEIKNRWFGADRWSSIMSEMKDKLINLGSLDQGVTRCL